MIWLIGVWAITATAATFVLERELTRARSDSARKDAAVAGLAENLRTSRERGDEWKADALHQRQQNELLLDRIHKMVWPAPAAEAGPVADPPSVAESDRRAAQSRRAGPEPVERKHTDDMTPLVMDDSDAPPPTRLTR